MSPIVGTSPPTAATAGSEVDRHDMRMEPDFEGLGHGVLPEFRRAGPPLGGSRVGSVEVAPPRHQRHGDFFLQQIASQDNLDFRQFAIAGEPGRVRDAREMNRLPDRGDPSV